MGMREFIKVVEFNPSSVNSTKHKRWLLPTCLLLLSACASSPALVEQIAEPSKPVAPIAHYPGFGDKPQMLTSDDIFSLSDEQEQEFGRYLRLNLFSDDMRHKRVSNYLKQFIDGFNYQNDTHTAAEAAELRRGNCLSLAILTTALARSADVEVAYELMQTPPVFQKRGNTIISSQHIRSVLYQPTMTDQSGFMFSFAPVIKIDYFPSSQSVVDRKVTEDEFVSMYFRNIAADAIVEERLVDAYWLVLEALAYSPDNGHAINMLALVFHNMGYNQDAEALYLYGIEHTDEQLELLSNYYKFLNGLERFDEAVAIKAEIDKIDEPNPFDWLELADQSVEEGNIDDALRYYNKAIDLAPYLHHGYFGKGKAEFLRGNYRRARKAIEKATELAYDEAKTLYEAKLLALSDYAGN